MAARRRSAARFAFAFLVWMTTAMAESSAPDFSARLDALWDYEHPETSEQRFRAELARHPVQSREALETRTQIARTQSLRRMFAPADATLDAVAPQLAAAPARVRVRYLLERGRTRNSSGDKAAAIALFNEAIVASGRDALPGADLYRVDALHMLGIASPAAERLDWSLKALAVATASTEAATRRKWAPSLYNNIGWEYFERGDPASALGYWQKALPLREESGNPLTIRIAKWTIARGQRALGQLDEAEAIQRALAVETEQAGEPDGYVYEELAEIALARGDAATAAPWAVKAWTLLKDNPDVRDADPARLARLRAVGDAQAPAR
jgi:tetratricopeptide (TPR) repeat protein